MDSVIAVVFCLTLKCNAKCAHCSAEAGPNRTEELRLDNVVRWLDDIKQLKQIQWVSFIGGEPFLYKGLAKAAKKARECNLKVKVFTNCFWATDLDAAKQTLQEVMPNHISVSADKYHQKFIELENVKNAIRACLDLRITVVCNTFEDENEIISDLRHEFGEALEIRPGAWIDPVGRAAQHGLGPTRRVEYFNFTCDARGRVVFVDTDGTVSFCCRHAATATGAFKIGSIYRSSLPDLIKRINPGLAVPQHRPIKELVKVVRAAGIEPVGRTPCELCCCMMKDAAMRKAIEDRYLR